MHKRPRWKCLLNAGKSGCLSTRALYCITAVIVILKTPTIWLSASCNTAQGFSSVISKQDSLPTQHNPVQRHEQGFWKQQSRSTHLIFSRVALFYLVQICFNLSGVLLGPEQLFSYDSSALHLLILKAPGLTGRLLSHAQRCRTAIPLLPPHFGFFLFWGWQVCTASLLRVPQCRLKTSSDGQHSAPPMVCISVFLDSDVSFWRL